MLRIDRIGPPFSHAGEKGPQASQPLSQATTVAARERGQG